MNENDSPLREPLLPSYDDLQEGKESSNCHSNQTTHSCFGDDEGEHPEDQQCQNDDSDNSFSVSESSSSYYTPEMLGVAKQNVRRTLAIVFFSFTSRSIWSQSLLSIFIVLVWKDRPEFVGYVLATTGLAQTLSSIVTRCATRRYEFLSNHSWVLLVLASLIGLGTMVVSFYVIMFQQSQFYLFLIANGLWGMSWGVLESALPIVFVESAGAFPKTMERNYKVCSTLVVLGNVAGTLFTIVLFEGLGNQWTVENCLSVMVLGFGCNLPVVFLLCSLRSIAFEYDEDLEEEPPELQDNDSLSVVEEQHDPDNDPFVPFFPMEEEIVNENYIVSGSSMEDRFFVPGNDDEDESSSSLRDLEASSYGEGDDESNNNNNSSSCHSFCCANKMRVPLLINAADVVSSLAGGMSTWYFPVFLVKQSNLGPMVVQCLYLVIPLGQWLSPKLAKGLSGCIGPCRACILMQWMYVVLILSMIACYLKGCPTWTVCALYVLHGSLMNSTSSLSHKMVAQYVPAEEHHKWGITTNLQMLLWSCAGLLGGYVVGRWGLLVNFYSTAVFQVVASVPLAILYCLLDPRLEESETMSTNDEYGTISRDDEEDDDDSNITPSGCTSSNNCKQIKRRPSAIRNDEEAFECSGHLDHLVVQSSRMVAMSPSTQATEILEESDSSSSGSFVSIHVV